MLDVHPPHEATHTWRDFFIHIATIVVGLLIAVGLEQTVEAIHHRIQRRELIESLLTESENNARACALNLQVIAEERRWSGEALQRMLQAKAGEPLVLPPFPEDKSNAANKVAWESALASGEVNLLDRPIRSRFSSVYQFYDNLWNTNSGYEVRDGALLYRLDTLIGHAPRRSDGSFDLTAFDSDQRKRIVDTLVEERTVLLGAIRQTMWLDSFSTAVLHAIRKDDAAFDEETEKQHQAIVEKYPESRFRLVTQPED
jgi:hypothetical protein